MASGSCDKWCIFSTSFIGCKIREVALSALPVRLRIDDTQAYMYMYIRMDCRGGNPVTALGVGGNGPWKKMVVTHNLKWPSSLVSLATYTNTYFFLTAHFCLVENC